MSRSFFLRLMFSIVAMVGLVPFSIYAEVTVEEVKQAVLKELGERPRTSADSSIFNPAMGVVLDVVASDSKSEKGNFDFRSVELNLQSTIDPFAKLYVIINGTDEGLAVEEAAVVTTALPAHLTARFGRFFANFGRLPKFHDHELPFVNRTDSLDTFIGGESKSDGAELTWLVPVPFFLQGTAGVSNKIGAENDRLTQTAGSGDTSGRHWNAMTYNARLFTYLPMGDNHGLDIGLSEAFTPRQNFIDGIPNSDHDNRRILTGGDVTYRYEPLNKNVFRKVIWGSEIFHNSERRRQELALDADGDGINETDTFERRSALGGYSYVEARMFRVFSGGGFYDYAESLDDHRNVTRTGGLFVNYIPSEYQKIRLQYSQVNNNQPNSIRDQQIFLQWMAVIGKHAHTFKDR